MGVCAISFGFGLSDVSIFVSTRLVLRENAVIEIDMFEKKCLVQLLRVGTNIEVGQSYRGDMRFSRKC